jgi:hypothetical protein
MRLDMAKLAFQPLTLRCKVTIGDAWVLESGENEHALIITERDDARWPMSKRLLSRASVHVDNSGGRIAIDAKEDLTVWRNYLVPAVCIAFELLAEEGSPFWKVLDLRQEVKRSGLRCLERQCVGAGFHKDPPFEVFDRHSVRGAGAQGESAKDASHRRTA